jgi:hypothetical protein
MQIVPERLLALRKEPIGESWQSEIHAHGLTFVFYPEQTAEL